MGNYIAKYTTIDRERGDMFMCEWNGTPFSQLLDLPNPEMAGRIIQAFLKWGKGCDMTPLDNPWENSILQNMVEYQRMKVKEYIRKCKNKSQSGGKSREKVAKGDFSLNKKIEKEKDKGLFSFSVRENRAPVDTAPVSLDSVEDAKKLLMMLAPPLDGDHYSEEDIEYFKGMDVEKEKDAVKAVMNSTDESKADDEQRKFSANTYRKFYRELGHDLFVRAYFRLDTEIANENAKYGNSDDSEDMSRYPEDAIARNPAKVFTARLKRLKDAAAATN